jgi:hypothetical protein
MHWEKRNPNSLLKEQEKHYYDFKSAACGSKQYLQPFPLKEEAPYESMGLLL